MAEGVYLPGNILSLAAGAADRLIRSGSGDAALLYLHLLRSGGKYRTGEAVKAMGWEPSRCDAALSLLRQLELADGEPEPAPAQIPDEPPEYSAEDINRELENKASPFPTLVNEVQRRLGKVLSTADLKSLYTIYDYSGLPPEVILLAMNWAIEGYQRKYGPGRMPRMPLIQREVFQWKERGVDTVDAAEAYLKRQTLLRDRSVQVLGLLDIRDRPPVAREKEYITGWLDMGFGDDAIRLAYERTVLKKQSMNWPYMDSILKSWHQQGLHTAKDISAKDSTRPRRPASGAGATAPQPTGGDADRRARADMERLREQMRREKEKEGK